MCISTFLCVCKRHTCSSVWSKDLLINPGSTMYVRPTQAHHGRINALAVAPPPPHRRAPLEVCTASADGSCVVWDLSTEGGAQLAMLRSPTNFLGVAFHPDGAQLVTVGTPTLGAV